MTRAKKVRLALGVAGPLVAIAVVAILNASGGEGAPPLARRVWVALALAYLFAVPLLAAAVRVEPGRDLSSLGRALLRALAPVLIGAAILLVAAITGYRGAILPCLAIALVAAGWSALAAGAVLALARVTGAAWARAIVVAVLLAGASLPFATSRALRSTDATRHHRTRRIMIYLGAHGSAWMSATRAWELAPRGAPRPLPPHLDGVLYDTWAGNDWPVPYPAWPLAALVPLAMGIALAGLSWLGKPTEAPRVGDEEKEGAA